MDYNMNPVKKNAKRIKFQNFPSLSKFFFQFLKENLKNCLYVVQYYVSLENVSFI